MRHTPDYRRGVSWLGERGRDGGIDTVPLPGGAIGNAPVATRADTLSPAGSQLRYVNCPQAPFLDSAAEGVCAGK